MAEDDIDTITLTAEIVAAYAAGNKVKADELPALIQSVHGALAGAGKVAVEPETAKATASQIKKSLTADALISFVDGKPYKSLKRHLSTQGMTPDDYRSRYGLPRDYPMVAPSYSAQRSELAKKLGLGNKRASSPPPAAAAKRGRRKQAEQTQQAQRDPSSAAIRPEDEEFA